MGEWLLLFKGHSETQKIPMLSELSKNTISRSQKGAYLEASRAKRRDCFNEESSFCHMMCAHSSENDEDRGAEWLVEPVENDSRVDGCANTFRLRLEATNRNSKQPSGVYLCAALPRGANRNKKLRRNEWSAWALAQPLWACDTSGTFSIWTTQPVPAHPGCFKLSLVLPNEEDAPPFFLESHRSCPGDRRGARSSYVHVSEAIESCAGHFVFEEAATCTDERGGVPRRSGSERPMAPVAIDGERRGDVTAAELYGGGITKPSSPSPPPREIGERQNDDGDDDEDSDSAPAMMGRRILRESFSSHDAMSHPSRRESPTNPLLQRLKGVAQTAVRSTVAVAQELKDATLEAAANAKKQIPKRRSNEG